MGRRGHGAVSSSGPSLARGAFISAGGDLAAGGRDWGADRSRSGRRSGTGGCSSAGGGLGGLKTASDAVGGGALSKVHGIRAAPSLEGGVVSAIVTSLTRV